MEAGTVVGRFTHRPARGHVSQPFLSSPTRNNPHPIYGDYQPAGHLGEDTACEDNADVVAVADGTVVYAGPGELMPAEVAAVWGYFTGPAGWASGNITIIDHGGNLGSTYSHQNRCTAPAGRQVRGGEVIGKAGDTGRSQGVHVHLEAIVLPVDYSSPLYSRIDPASLYGPAAILPAGTITEEEELVPNHTDQVFDTITGGPKVSLNELLNSIDRKQDQQGAVLAQLIQLTSAVLTTRVADPLEPGKTWSVLEWIVGGATNARQAAGSAAAAMERTEPATLANLLTTAQASVDAAAVADQLTVSLKKTTD